MSRDIICSSCGGLLIQDESRGTIVCFRCGLVDDDVYIDPGAEWRVYDHKEGIDRIRTGAPENYMIHDKGLSTVIDYQNKDGMGKDLTPDKITEINRLRKWQIRSKIADGADRSLANALLELDRLGSAIHAPQMIREAAAKLYRKVVKMKLTRGRTINGLVAACLYAKCREFNFVRTLSDFHAVSDEDRKRIGKNYRFLCREFNLTPNIFSPMSFLPKYASELGINQECVNCARRIIQSCIDNGILSGKDARGVCAASIYIAGKLTRLNGLTQEKIARVAQITHATVRSRYKDLCDRFGFWIKKPKES